MQIQKATINDHLALSALTKKSKAFWGYSDAQIKAWEEVLTISAAYIEQNEVYKLVHDGEKIGYYSYFKIDENTAYLDNLFLLPAYIGKGIGSLLMNNFLNKVKQAGFSKIRLDADPHAEAFYLKFGFKVVGKLETSIEGRYLPMMEFIFS